MRFESKNHDGYLTWEPDGSDLLGLAGEVVMIDSDGDVLGRWKHTLDEAVETAGTCGYFVPASSHSSQQSVKKGGV